MNDRLRQALCDIVAAHGPAVADDPRRCAELLRAASDDRAGVDALLRALEVQVAARLSLVTEALAPASVTSGLVRRLVEEQGLSDQSARWAVDAWARALGKTLAAPDGALFSDHTLAPPTRRRPWRLIALAAAVAAALGAWWWLGQGAEVRRFTTHTDGVTSLALSADGRLLLVGGMDHSLRLWDVDGATELRRFDGHTERLARVALSPDGSRALSCSGVVDRRDGKLVRASGASSRVVERIDGKLVALDCTVRLWDVATGTELRRLGEPAVPQYGVAFTPDGRQALTFGGGHELRDGEFVLKDGKYVPRECVLKLYDVESGRELRQFSGHKEPVYCAAFTPDGRRLVSGSADGTVLVWEVGSGAGPRSLDVGGKSAVLSVAVSPDGRRLLTGDANSRLRLWNLDDGEEVYDARTAHSGWLRGVAFSPDGRRALTGGDDFLVRLWDVDEGAEKRHFTGHTEGVTGVAFLPDGRTGVSGGADGTVRLWRLPR